MLEAKFTKKLWHFTLEVDLTTDNQIVVLWGPSGSGKTTFLHCLAGLAKPSSGFIKLNNRVLYSSSDKINLATRNRNIGYLFQDYALFPHMTVKENILYGVQAKGYHLSKEEVLHLNHHLDFLGIEHLVNRYPRQLSGGEKQRAALARALQVQPHMLLLDEPFSALDKQNKIRLREQIKYLHQDWNIPFLIVTHDEEDAASLGDIIISLIQGKILEISTLSCGTPTPRK